MHLFKNKNKDVKHFLDQMKANKTNRSSNISNLSFDKKPKPPLTTSPEPYQSEYRANNISQPKPSNYDSRPKETLSNFNNHDANSLRSSIVSNPRSLNSIHTLGHNFAPSQSFSNQLSQYPPRQSQNQQIYREPIPRPQYNQPHFEPSYRPSERFTNFQPESSQNFNHEFAQSAHRNSSRNSFELSRSSVEYQKPVYTPFNPYQSQVHQGYNQSQNHRNFNQASPENRISQQFPQNVSQRSNQQSFDRLHQSQNQQSVNSHYRQIEEKPIIQNFQNFKPTNENTYQNHVLKSSNVRSSTQFDSKPLINQNTSCLKAKLYTSQFSEMAKPMELISEIDDCFSTQNDSPAKFTQFLSKSKFNQEEIEEVLQPEIIPVPQQKSIILQQKVQIKTEVQKEQKTGKTPDFKRKKGSPQKKEGAAKRREKSPAPKKDKIMVQKGVLTQENVEILAKVEPKISQIIVSEIQRHKTEKALHQVDQVHIKLDGIYKEASIILNNIKRSHLEFRKKIQNNFLMQRKDRREYQEREESNDFTVKGKNFEAETEKKGHRKPGLSSIDILMNERQTEKKPLPMRHNEEIEI